MKHNPKFKMWISFLTTILLTSTMITSSEAYFRHLCHGQLGIGRIDPIVSAGKTSAHVHNIQGAANFGFDPSLTQMLASNCTTCSIRQDKSAYWSPIMYFQHANGTFQLVQTTGGLTAYYFTETPDVGDKVVAFPQNFRMITGNNSKRANIRPLNDIDMTQWKPEEATQEAINEVSIGFNCLNYGAAAEGSMEYHYLRNKTFLDEHCAQGIRAEIMFPSCWNGKDLDSSDHKSHIQFPVHQRNGACPDGFKTRLPALFFETIYLTNLFKSLPGTFVFANGDPTGYGYHADFLCGWDEGVLQQAIDNSQCTGPYSGGDQYACPVFQGIKGADDPDTISCKMTIPDVIKDEQLDFVHELPGKVAIQSGPQPATMGNMSMLSSTAQPVSPSGAPIASATTLPSALGSMTSTAVAPSNTLPPTTSTSPSRSIITKTSTSMDHGTVYHWVILEEIVTTTVMANSPAPTHAKRHIHARHHINRR